MPSHSTRSLSGTRHASPSQTGQKRKQSDVDADRSSDSTNVRRRITRACDQCNQLRTKCDGKQPCVHCAQNKLTCNYARIHKKRGRVSKKELGNSTNAVLNGSDSQVHQHSGIASNHSSSLNANTTSMHFDKHQNLAEAEYARQHGSFDATNVNEVDRSGTEMVQRCNEGNGNSMLPHSTFDYDISSANSFIPELHMAQGFGFPLGDDYSVAFMGKAPLVESPDWMTLVPVMHHPQPDQSVPTTLEGVKYPVLLPLLPHLEPIMPQQLACDLLEQYFTTSTNVHLQPKNPYVIGSMFRKISVLHSSNPRPCAPGLLASMLWISAQHSDAVFLTSHPDARSRTCQQLLELTIGMLKPLVHSSGVASRSGDASQTTTSHTDSGLAGLVSPLESVKDFAASRTQLDNIATYMHLATVVSASERKAASLRWWNAAWSLAREIRLGREMPDEPSTDLQHVGEHGSSGSPSTSVPLNGQGSIITEEYREERRRVWWLLYMTDRHLALCYNRPLSFLNQECASLLLPVDDEIWQSEHYTTYAPPDRRRGLGIQCTSHSVFGYFLPLMVLLGEILDLNYARNRPKLGSRINPTRVWDQHVNEIVEYLKQFEESVAAFEKTGPQKLMAHYSTYAPSAVEFNVAGQEFDTSQAHLQTDTIVAYSRHIMHVLHILLTGKWDPIALLDDNDLWISSQSFVTATGHAVSAANDLSDIIEYDPDLSLIPYFFGIYLLQGSFLLLLFADKLQDDISPDVVKACETIVRAHEACVATLDTQYQRNFRKVMRSALQQLRGRRREDPVQQQKWRRGILKLYRWTSDGTGLAL